jgi:ABC-type multidrug transport system fused ATPase/permease subunit
MKIFWGRLNVGMLNVSSMYFFPQVLSAVVFSVYIGSGHPLALGMAYTVMTCFNLLKEPMRYLPWFIGQFVELLISLKRIQDFLVCDTLNPTVIKTFSVRL